MLDRTGAAEANLLALREVPEPHAGPGEVVIAVEACGVCRTDLHLVEGEVSAPLPLIPGHQAAGRVVEVGAGVTHLREGDLAGVGWLHSTCGKCRFCRSGRENVCERARFSGRDVPGGYAERLLADARFAYKLPPAFDRSTPHRCSAPASLATARCASPRSFPAASSA